MFAALKNSFLLRINYVFSIFFSLSESENRNPHLAESKLPILKIHYKRSACEKEKGISQEKRKEKKPLKRKKTSEKKVVNRIPIFLPFLMYPYFPCVRRLYWEKCQMWVIFKVQHFCHLLDLFWLNLPNIFYLMNMDYIPKICFLDIRNLYAWTTLYTPDANSIAFLFVF